MVDGRRIPPSENKLYSLEDSLSDQWLEIALAADPPFRSHDPAPVKRVLEQFSKPLRNQWPSSAIAQAFPGYPLENLSLRVLSLIHRQKKGKTSLGPEKSGR